ncbi:hypothetical protein C8R44DRAFT_896194 [Mycena epipterygia]|nr:hypothetical protein C8R44DRAFT_896194 [Mycena epipterygia]
MVRVHLAIMCWPIGSLDLVAAAQGVRQGRAAWAALGHPAEDYQTQVELWEDKALSCRFLGPYSEVIKLEQQRAPAGRLKVAKFAPSELAAELTGAEFSHNTRCGPAGASAHQGLVPLGCGEQHQVRLPPSKSLGLDYTSRADRVVTVRDQTTYTSSWEHGEKPLL